MQACSWRFCVCESAYSLSLRGPWMGAGSIPERWRCPQVGWVVLADRRVEKPFPAQQIYKNLLAQVVPWRYKWAFMIKFVRPIGCLKLSTEKHDAFYALFKKRHSVVLKMFISSWFKACLKLKQLYLWIHHQSCHTHARTWFIIIVIICVPLHHAISPHSLFIGLSSLSPAGTSYQLLRSALYTHFRGHVMQKNADGWLKCLHVLRATVATGRGIRQGHMLLLLHQRTKGDSESDGRCAARFHPRTLLFHLQPGRGERCNTHTSKRTCRIAGWAEW